MTVDQMASMISYMDAWGAQNGVTFTDPVPLSPPRDGAQGKPASGGGRG
jgi:hypothetical protein